MRILILIALLLATPLARAGSPDIQAPSPTGELVAPLRLDRLADCLRRSGTVFYGASWCPRCVQQLRSFGVAAAQLPYVECSIGGTREQTRACKAAGIEGYPTWIFPSGAQRRGFRQPQDLARLSGCPVN